MLPYFYTLSHNGAIFGGGGGEKKMKKKWGVFIFLKFFLKKFFLGFKI
jgi:hypothetical protein